MFNAMKDRMTSKAAQMYLNKYISRYGELQDFKIDSQNRTLEVIFLPQGENEAITLRIDSYTIEDRGGKKYIQATACSCSRPWMNNLLKDFVQGRQVEVPPWAVSALG